MGNVEEITLKEIRHIKARSAFSLAGIYGVPVFRVVENGKKPAEEGWQQAATNDVVTVENLWREGPDYNIGVSTSGLIVVDLDPKDGGEESWRQIVEERALFGDEVPQTLEVRTWSGGRHIYFRTPLDARGERIEVRGSVGKNGGIAPGIDIRAHGNLVVGPGSIIDGKPYRVIKGKDGLQADGRRRIALAPQWLVDLTKKKIARAENAGTRVTEETEAGVREARKLVDDHPPVARGARNDSWYKLAAQFGDLGLNIETARDEGWRWVEEKVGGMDEGEFEKTLASAYGPGRANPIGNMNPGALPGEWEAVDVGKPPSSRAPSVESGESTEAPPRRKIKSLWFKDAWPLSLTHSSKPLVRGLLDEGAFSVTYGASGSGKSFLMLDIAFHIAAGLPWNGMKVRRGPVAYVAAEGGTGIYKRLHALRKHYGIEDVPFAVIPVSVDLLKGDDLKELVEEIKMRQEEIGEPFVYIGIDTVSRVLAGGNENGPEDMGRLVRRFDQIRAVTSAHLNAVHHSGKQAALGARGHSLLKAATDTEIEVAVVVKNQSFDLKVTKQREGAGGLKMRFKFKPIPLGKDDRDDPISSNVIEPSTSVEPDMDAPTLLRDAVASKLEREGRSTDSRVKRAFVIEAAKEAKLGDFDPRGNQKNFEDRIDRLLGNACTFLAIRRLKRGQYQCLFEGGEENEEE